MGIAEYQKTKMKNVCACGSNEFKVLFNAKFNKKIVKCNSCGLVRIYPFTEHNYSEDNPEYYIKNEKLFEIYMKEIFDIVKKYKKKGKVLDVGCNIGLLLKIFEKDGWDAIGIELSEKAANYAIKEGHKVFQKELGEIKFNRNSFDVITLVHVLEHIENLNGFLDKVRKNLKRNGLLIVSAPNFNSLSAKVLRSRWAHLHSEQHLWYFTRETLSSILENKGFKVIETIISEPYRDYSGFKGIIKRICLWPGYFLSDKLGMGRNMIVIAKR